MDRFLGVQLFKIKKLLSKSRRLILENGQEEEMARVRVFSARCSGNDPSLSDLLLLQASWEDEEEKARRK